MRASSRQLCCHWLIEAAPPERRRASVRGQPGWELIRRGPVPPFEGGEQPIIQLASGPPTSSSPLQLITSSGRSDQIHRDSQTSRPELASMPVSAEVPLGGACRAPARCGSTTRRKSTARRAAPVDLSSRAGSCSNCPSEAIAPASTGGSSPAARAKAQQGLQPVLQVLCTGLSICRSTNRQPARPRACSASHWSSQTHASVEPRSPRSTASPVSPAERGRSQLLQSLQQARSAAPSMWPSAEPMTAPLR